jgi:hypothetical protein
MPITSLIVDDRPGRGHTEHGQGKGLGHLKHAQADMDDGVYTIGISGIDVSNPSLIDNLVSAQVTLADGSLLNTEVRGGSIGIDDVPGDTGTDEALHLVTDSNGGRLRVNIVFDGDQQFQLGDLDTLHFNYFVEESSRTDVIPVIRLIIDADGDLTTTGDRGELVFEWAYQSFGSTTEDIWQNADLAGGDWVAWQRSSGTNWDQIANMTELSDWADADGHTVAGGLTFDEDSLVLGYSIAVGSGNGTNDVYVDDLVVNGVTYDFIS